MLSNREITKHYYEQSFTNANLSPGHPETMYQVNASKYQRKIEGLGQNVRTKICHIQQLFFMNVFVIT